MPDRALSVAFTQINFAQRPMQTWREVRVFFNITVAFYAQKRTNLPIHRLVKNIGRTTRRKS
jgi:hypothetical protein